LATLVLSTVGTALGGPIGSAIGSMIGQSIDQQLLAPPRRGPRVGDLAVQTSTYGTQVPRLYGTMRVAGSVIWSTDLIENEQTNGAKGQPDVSYNYTVSLAVALSSRPVTAIKRIWADGKLLRGEAGDLKVGGTLRLATGSEEQDADPFIASVEGIDSTPAYRGLALAVFEGLELAEYGNRIPFFTFEVEAAGGDPTCGEIISDASAGAIRCDASDVVRGYAAYGRSIRSAVEPLVESFGIELFDDGDLLNSPASIQPLEISEFELGNSLDGDAVSGLEREQLPARFIPSSVSLNFYDPARDFQAGEARASAGDNVANESRQELPAVLSANDAKSLAQRMLSRAWCRRDKLTVRLPRRRIDLQPGDELALPLSPRVWIVEQVTIEGFVTVVDVRPSPGTSVDVAADPGRVAPNPDLVAGPVSLALVDVPALPGMPTDQPTMLLAASQREAGWKTRPVEIGFGGQSIATTTARSKSVLGQASTVLGAGSIHLIDTINSVEVQLLDESQWLVGRDDDALSAGANLAVVGREVLQFGTATSLGSGKFRLSRLLRGRGGTEWAQSEHVVGEGFCLLRPGTLQAVELPAWSLGAELNATVGGTQSASVFQGESLRPLSVVNLRAERTASGGLRLTWTRRSRRGYSWIDGVDVPLGEASERYRIKITGTAGSIELSSEVSELVVDASALASIGPGPATIQVVQVGDFLASRPEELDIIIA
jgi:hypothetical protein